MPEMQGAADILMVPDPSTFRVLPWAPDTGWFLCDLQFPDGRPVPFSTRCLLRKALERLGERRLRIRRRPGSRVPRLQDHRPAPAARGCRAAGQPARGRAAHDRLPAAHRAAATTSSTRSWSCCAKNLERCELPLRSFEIEFGPSQLEFTLAPLRRHGGRGRDGPAAQRGEADRAPPRLPRHLHVPAEAAERHVERLAFAPVARRETA